ncbi:MAG: response regulator [Acidobacteria bacterium]|nr:response regulator [Acidobacteriota bacterium]
MNNSSRIFNGGEHNRGLILIVDDFEDVREMYAQFLNTEGFKVALASDGEEAVDKALRLRPDVVVMDLRLPGINGWEAAQRIRQNESNKNTGVIIMTAFANAAPAVIRNGCDAFLGKPCAPDRLLKEITTLVDRKRQSVPAN